VLNLIIAKHKMVSRDKSWPKDKKLVSYSVLYPILRKLFREKIKILWETEYEFRFTKFETDSVIRFEKIIRNFFLKRITESVSQFCETEFVFRFLQNFQFFPKRLM